MEQKRYFYDENTDETLTYVEMEELWERYKDDKDFCTYDTDNFDAYLDALLRDMGAGVREIDKEDYVDYMYDLAEKDAEEALCSWHCPFNHNIECSQCDAFHAVRDYMFDIIKEVKGE